MPGYGWHHQCPLLLVHHTYTFPRLRSLAPPTPDRRRTPGPRRARHRAVRGVWKDFRSVATAMSPTSYPPVRRGYSIFLELCQSELLRIPLLGCEYPREWSWATSWTGLTLLLGEPMVPWK
jgi:hypothetical protein